MSVETNGGRTADLTRRVDERSIPIGCRALSQTSGPAWPASGSVAKIARLPIRCAGLEAERACSTSTPPETSQDNGRAGLSEIFATELAICIFKQGRIADRTHEAQRFQASDLNLVIAAIVHWNSTYIADAVAHLRAIGEDVPDDLLAHSSTVGWGPIAFSGDFLWDRAAAMPTGRAAQSWANEHRCVTERFSRFVRS